MECLERRERGEEEKGFSYKRLDRSRDRCRTASNKLPTTLSLSLFLFLSHSLHHSLILFLLSLSLFLFLFLFLFLLPLVPQSDRSVHFAYDQRCRGDNVYPIDIHQNTHHTQNNQKKKNNRKSKRMRKERKEKKRKERKGKRRNTSQEKEEEVTFTIFGFVKDVFKICNSLLKANALMIKSLSLVLICIKHEYP